MLELNVINKLPDNKVLISEQNKNSSKPVQRYYVADEANADKFIKCRKQLSDVDGAQGIWSIVLAACTGLVVGFSIKNIGKTLKALASLAVGGAAYLGIKQYDKMVDKQAQKNNIRHFKVEEITADKEKVDAAINYKENESSAGNNETKSPIEE